MCRPILRQMLRTAEAAFSPNAVEGFPRVVCYRGPDFDHASGVSYRNVENYLSGLKA